MREYHTNVAEVEDVTGSAGWMYTDLLVGLMVIFLATITFIPEGTRFVDPRAVQTFTEIYPTPLANKYFEYNFRTISNNVNDFVVKEGFSGSESVARAQIVVSYNPREESNGSAITKATDIANRLKQDDPLLFKESVFQLRTVQDTSRPYFVLELTFDRFVQVLSSERNR